MAHADMVLKEFIRADGSVCHIVSFNPETGERIEEIGGQAYGVGSAWSRGISWALYGMTLSYKYTGKQEYLDAAKKVSHFFISNLSEDSVPFWDFRSPEDDFDKDSSAGACAASGLIELSQFFNGKEKQLYHNAALRILKSLYENYCHWGEDEQGILLEGTGHKPKNTNVNVPLIYGDYFFVEALSKLQGYTELFWLNFKRLCA